MNEPSAGPIAELLSIGSELLAGETVDTNAAFLGAALARLGIPLQGGRTLPDEQAAIAAAFVEARSRSDLVVATGGLGPTHDDLTREGLADALGEPLALDAALEAELRRRFAAYGRMPESNLRQAMLIPSAAVLPNPIGSAPGWWVDRDGSVTVLMPGVPSEMRLMWTDEVAPRFAARFALRPVHARTVKTFGIGESAVVEATGDLLDNPGDGVSAGIYARDDGVHLRFSTRGDAPALDAPVDRAIALLGEHVYGTDDDHLAAVALNALGRRGMRSLASVESGTAGTLLAILAEAPNVDGAASYLGGLLVIEPGDDNLPPQADATLRLSLLPADDHGRSPLEVSLTGGLAVGPIHSRVHGSGPQRQRRGAFAALDGVRRALA